MWAITMVVVMAALTGVYMLPPERSAMAVRDLTARELAESMGVYRQSVVKYFSANNVTNTSISIDTLKSTGVVPTWSTLYTQSSTAIWANYRNSAGVIYIYPATMPSVNITSELMKLSQYSLTVGLYRASDNSVYSPVDGTRVTHASLAAVSIPDNAPVWMAARH
jgi:hypothetical protein